MDKTEQIPWSVRVQRASSGVDGPSGAATRIFRQLLQTPAPTLILGAALLSRQPRLLWELEALLDEAIADERTQHLVSGQTLLARLMNQISSANPDKKLRGYVLLFHFLVEPFAMVNRSAAFYPADKSPGLTAGTRK